jgi:hypothetical protein
MVGRGFPKLPGSQRLHLGELCFSEFYLFKLGLFRLRLVGLWLFELWLFGLWFFGLWFFELYLYELGLVGLWLVDLLLLHEDGLSPCTDIVGHSDGTGTGCDPVWMQLPLYRLF